MKEERTAGAHTSEVKEFEHQFEVVRAILKVQ